MCVSQHNSFSLRPLSIGQFFDREHQLRTVDIQGVIIIGFWQDIIKVEKHSTYSYIYLKFFIICNVEKLLALAKTKVK